MKQQKAYLMHELRRISLMNWNVLTLEDIEISGATAIIGAVGVGKSTILDAIQTVMSGHNQHIISLNRAASSQKSSRTVKEYCLGVTEETVALNLVRTKCRSMIILTFYEQQLKQHYSIGLLLYADQDKSKAETEVRWVAPGVDFSFRQFADKDSDGNMCVLDPRQLIERIRKASGREFQTHNSSARSFADAYLRGMRLGGGGVPDQFSVLKRFRNAIAFEEIQNPTDFVRKFVLEEKTVHADSLRSNLHHWDTITAKLQEIKALTSEASSFRNHYRNYGRREVAKLLYDVRKFWHVKRATELDRIQIGADLKECSRKIKKLETERAHVQGQIRTEAVEKEKKKDRESALENSTERIEAKHQLDRAESALTQSRRELSDGISLYTRTTKLSSLGEWTDDVLPGAEDAGVRLMNIAGDIRSRVPVEDWKGEVLHYTQLIHSATDAIPELERSEEELIAQISVLKNERVQLKEIIGGPDSAGNFVSPVTSAAKRALDKAHIPAEVLPDLIEIREDVIEWAGALEAVLGLERETIFVPADKIADALHVIYALPQANRSHVRVSAMEDDQPATSDDIYSDSIASIATASEPYALSYLYRHFGSVIMAHSEEEFVTSTDAVMQSGVRKNAQVYATGIPNDLILGSLAKRRRLDEAKLRLEEVEEILEEDEALLREYRAALSELERIADVDSGNTEILIGQYEMAISSLVQAQKVYSASASPEATALRAEIAEHTRKLEDLQADIEDRINPNHQGLIEARIGLEHQAKAADKHIENCEARIRGLVAQDETEEFTTFRRGFARVEIAAPPARDAPPHKADDTIERRVFLQNMTAEQELQLLAEADTDDFDLHNQRAAEAEEAIIEVISNIKRLEGYASIKSFLENNDLDLSISNWTKHDQFIWICDYVDHLEGSELKKYEDKITERAAEVYREVHEMLVLNIFSGLEAAREKLKGLNTLLQPHLFEGLSYVFTWSVDPEMRPIFDLATRVKENAAETNAILQDDSDPMMKEAIETIRKIFSSDVTTQRFEDYRNYFTYDVRMSKKKLSKEQIESQTHNGFVEDPEFIGSLNDRVGKGSGGQKQTPYYVAIAASMAAAYYPQSKKGVQRGVGLVCFDEAFSKLDIHNTQELLRFFKSLNLQVLIAAPEEKRASFMELVDTIVNLSKPPGEPFLYIDSNAVGPRARRELADANPDHIGLQGFRDRIGVSGKAAE